MWESRTNGAEDVLTHSAPLAPNCHWEIEGWRVGITSTNTDRNTNFQALAYDRRVVADGEGIEGHLVYDSEAYYPRG